MSSPEQFDPDVPLEKLFAMLPVSLRRIAAVLRFEIRRTRTTQRMFALSIIILFPIAIMTLIRIQDNRIEDEVWGLVVYGLIPQIVCMLGLLLWVAPVVHSELEGRTWTYLAVRPSGKLSMLLGKYLNGVGWTLSGAWLGLTLGMLIAQPMLTEPFRFWWVMCLLSLLSCLAYGAVYSLLGALFPRKSMVVTFAYMFVFEVVVSNIPAVINQVTVHRRLLSLLFRLMEWQTLPGTTFEVGELPAAFHLAILVVYTTVLLAAAAGVIRWREYVTSEEPH